MTKKLYKKYKFRQLNKKKLKKIGKRYCNFEGLFPYIFRKKPRKLEMKCTPYYVKFAHNYSLIISLIMVLITVSVFAVLIKSFSAIKLALLLIFIALTLLAIIPAITQIIYNIRSRLFFEFNEEDFKKNFLEVNDGKLGAGKTALGVTLSYLKSQLSWTKLRLEIFFLKFDYKRILKSNDKDNILDLIFKFESYNYWASHPELIPCLLSNIPIEYKGLKCAELTPDYIFQKKKVPYLSVLFYDEISTELESTTKSKQSSYADAGTFCRFARQFGNFRITATDQHRGSANLSFRKCVGSNRYIESQEWVGYSRFLNRLYNHLEQYIIDKYIDNNIEITKFNFKIRLFLFLSKFFKHNGFRKFTFIESGSTESPSQHNNALSSKKKTFIIPADLFLVEYASEAFKLAYKPLSETLDISVYDSMIIKRDEVINRFFKLVKLKKDNKNANNI